MGRHLAFEGSGAYLARGTGSSAASLSASLTVDLARGDSRAVPYVAAGGGLYRTSFDTSNARFAGPAPSGVMGTGRYSHTVQAAPPGWDLGELAPFYADRVAGAIAREGRGSVTFNDPALNLGAGVRIRVGRSWSVRQDARAELVIRNGNVYTAGVFTIQLGRGF